MVFSATFIIGLAGLSWQNLICEMRYAFHLASATLAVWRRRRNGWLMCHALNLTGGNFSAHRTSLEDLVLNGDLHLSYNVRDIETYLKCLDPSKFTELQIANAWMIQDFILRLTGPEQRG